MTLDELDQAVASRTPPPPTAPPLVRAPPLDAEWRAIATRLTSA